MSFITEIPSSCDLVRSVEQEHRGVERNGSGNSGRRRLWRAPLQGTTTETWYPQTLQLTAEDTTSK